MKTSCPWDERQVKTFVKEAVKSVGGESAWAFLGRAIQTAVIEAKVTSVLTMQLDDTTLKAAEIKALWRAMMTAAGLWDGE